MGSVDDHFACDPEEPLGHWLGPHPPPPTFPELRALRFEFSSRGDRVPGRLLLPPEGEGPWPLVLLQHGAGGCRAAPYVDAVGGPWARAGAAVATIDFPLHGERASPKLGELLERGLLARAEHAGPARDLVVEFTRQSVVDLRRALDALALLPQLDCDRLAYAGLSLGSIVGATFCAVDPRPRAAALALGGGGGGTWQVDPVHHVGRFAPRPLLFVNARHDEAIPRVACEALHAAAAEPKQVLWFDSGHTDLPGRAFAAMWRFLKPHLELAGG